MTGVQTCALPIFSSDYGTAYLVAAGMLNVLAVLDCYDIAMGRKN